MYKMSTGSSFPAILNSAFSRDRGSLDGPTIKKMNQVPVVARIEKCAAHFLVNSRSAAKHGAMYYCCVEVPFCATGRPRKVSIKPSTVPGYGLVQDQDTQGHMSAILSEVTPTPAERLLGHTTQGGWEVTELLRSAALNAPGMTGANFSVGYKVNRNNPQTGGRETAFLKALDVDRALRSSTDLIGDLRGKLNEFAFERGMHEFCRDRHMSRVVRAIEAGDLMPNSLPGDRINQVPFLVLEIADQGDARSWVNKISNVETVLKLSYLHHVLTGLQQLHKATVAHSDLKPSNVMIFRQDGAKIGDLGRVINGAGNCPFTGNPYPGDYSYAPPEILYRAPQSDWVNGRERIDLFQWGALCSYLFSGVELNTWLMSKLDVAVQPSLWGGNGPSYTMALPYLIDAFEKTLEELGNDSFPAWAADSLVALIRETAHPDYAQRGDASVTKRTPNMTGLDRLITRVSILVKRADVQVRVNDNATKAEKARSRNP